MVIMERGHHPLMGLFTVLAIVLISGCIQQNNPPSQIRACSWVFKTKGNYSDLVSVLVNQNRTMVTAYPFFGPLNKLDSNYYSSIWACAYSDNMGIAFTSITWGEWDQSQNACSQQIIDKEIQVRIQKCGSLNFDMFEECRDYPSPTGHICVETVSSPNVSNPTICSYNVTPDDISWNTTCEPTLSSEDFLNRIIDYKPLTELYLCNISSGQLNTTNQLNTMIDNGELSTLCEKKI